MLPSGLSAIASGAGTVPAVDTGLALSAPVRRLMAYWAMVAPLTLTTYRLLPSGATARSCGPRPVATFAGDVGVSFPVAGLMRNWEIALPLGT
jgi:hypothetical protein